MNQGAFVVEDYGAEVVKLTKVMVFLGLGIVVGGLVGLLTLTVGGLPLTLTTSGGALIMGPVIVVLTQ